ncbi:hypothetical protein FKM82_025684, partial [Ascaphus truei]
MNRESVRVLYMDIKCNIKYAVSSTRNVLNKYRIQPINKGGGRRGRLCSITDGGRETAQMGGTGDSDHQIFTDNKYSSCVRDQNILCHTSGFLSFFSSLVGFLQKKMEVPVTPSRTPAERQRESKGLIIFGLSLSLIICRQAGHPGFIYIPRTVHTDMYHSASFRNMALSTCYTDVVLYVIGERERERGRERERE